MISLKILKAKIVYGYATLMADKAAHKTGKQQFVLMADNGKLIVMDDSHFYKLRKCGSMPRFVTPRMLKRVAVYHTDGSFKGKPSQRMADTTRDRRKKRYMAYVRKGGLTNLSTNADKTAV